MVVNIFPYEKKNPLKMGKQRSQSIIELFLLMILFKVYPHHKIGFTRNWFYLVKSSAALF